MEMNIEPRAVAGENGVPGEVDADEGSEKSAVVFGHGLPLGLLDTERRRDFDGLSLYKYNEVYSLKKTHAH